MQEFQTTKSARGEMHRARLNELLFFSLGNGMAKGEGGFSYSMKSLSDFSLHDSFGSQWRNNTYFQVLFIPSPAAALLELIKRKTPSCVCRWWNGLIEGLANLAGKAWQLLGAVPGRRCKRGGNYLRGQGQSDNLQILLWFWVCVPAASGINGMLGYAKGKQVGGIWLVSARLLL